MKARWIAALAGLLLSGAGLFSLQIPKADAAEKFIPPADSGAPKPIRRPRQRGYVGRELLPEGTVVGLTAQDKPPLYVHVNHGLDRPVEAVLYVIDADEAEGYESTVQLPASEGIVEIPLPNTLSALTVGKSYRWTLYLKPDGEWNPHTPTIRGVIERVQPVLTPQQIASLSVTERLEAYGEAQLWYDQLFTLALMQKQESQNPQWNKAWKDLLNGAGLETAAEQPLLFP